MNELTAFIAATALVTTAGLVQAKDLNTDDTNKLVTAGTIQSVEKLNEAALALHPGASIDDTELEEEHGRYIYQVEIRDAKLE